MTRAQLAAGMSKGNIDRRDWVRRVEEVGRWPRATAAVEFDDVEAAERTLKCGIDALLPWDLAIAHPAVLPLDRRLAEHLESQATALIQRVDEAIEDGELRGIVVALVTLTAAGDRRGIKAVAELVGSRVRDKDPTVQERWRRLRADADRQARRLEAMTPEEREKELQLQEERAAVREARLTFAYQEVDDDGRG